jgi:hypothetical protein
LAEIHLFRRDFILIASRFIVSRWFTHICRKFIEGEKLFFSPLFHFLSPHQSERWSDAESGADTDIFRRSSDQSAVALLAGPGDTRSISKGMPRRAGVGEALARFLEEDTDAIQNAVARQQERLSVHWDIAQGMPDSGPAVRSVLVRDRQGRAYAGPD